MNHHDSLKMPEPQLDSSSHNDRSIKFWHKSSHDAPPPPYSQQAAQPPLSGYRLPLSSRTPFPASTQVGRAPCTDLDPHHPIFLGSAIFEKSVHPCKIAPHLPNPCRVPYAGMEYEHTGRYDLLPFDPATMEWVRTSNGTIPHGRRPVEGGYEENGQKLYHAIGVVDGVRVPGKTAQHLGGCNVAFGGSERFNNDYEILCWKH